MAQSYDDVIPVATFRDYKPVVAEKTPKPKAAAKPTDKKEN